MSSIGGIQTHVDFFTTSSEDQATLLFLKRHPQVPLQNFQVSLLHPDICPANDGSSCFYQKGNINGIYVNVDKVPKSFLKELETFFHRYGLTNFSADFWDK